MLLFFISNNLNKGIAEVADLVAVTKYDGNLKQEAVRVKSEYVSAMKYLRRKSKFWTPKVSNYNQNLIINYEF